MFFTAEFFYSKFLKQLNASILFDRCHKVKICERVEVFRSARESRFNLSENYREWCFFLYFVYCVLALDIFYTIIYFAIIISQAIFDDNLNLCNVCLTRESLARHNCTWPIYFVHKETTSHMKSNYRKISIAKNTRLKTSDDFKRKLVIM